MRPAPAVMLLAALAGPGALAQNAPARSWREGDRVFITDAWRATAVAATPTVVYSATPYGLAIYERAFQRLRETIGPLDGFPFGPGPVRAMAADPADDTAWLAASGRWAAYYPLGRRWDTGVLPGTADLVVLDSREPSSGAWFRTSGGWYFVGKGSLSAVPARDVPPPERRLGQLSAQQLLARAPAFDVVRMRLESDDQLRNWVMTAGAAAPVSSEAYITTNGNGTFKVDLATYGVERLPSGLLSAAAGGLALVDGRVCVGSDVRFERGRRGLTCLRDDLTDFSYFEGGRIAGMPGGVLRRLAATRRSLWAATDRGLVRVDRRGGEVLQLMATDGLPADDVRAVLAVRGTGRAPDGVWAGTSRGIAFVPDSGRSPEPESVMTTSAAVFSMVMTGDTLWLGTAAGLLAFVPGEGILAPAGPVALREPVAAIARRSDTLLVATDTRLAWRIAGEWQVSAPPGFPIGRLTQVAADADGFWVAGTDGFAFFRPGAAIWVTLTDPADVPPRINDIVADRRYVWVATRSGLVRYERGAIVR